MATTFAAGQTINLSLDGNDTITWVGSGNMTVTPASGPSWAVHLEGSQTYGPFGKAVSVSIVTVTNGNYTVNGGSFPVVANESPLTGGIEISVNGVRIGGAHGAVTVNDSAAASANTLAIQKLLDGGGHVSITAYGTVYIGSRLKIGSNTTLVLNDECEIRNVSGANDNMLVSKAKEYAWIPVSSVAWASGREAVFTAAGHDLSVGDFAWVDNAVSNIEQSAFKGVFRVSAVSGNDVTVVIHRTPTAGTVPSASGWNIKKATVKCRVIGGVWNYDAPANAGSVDEKKHAIYFAGVANSSVDIAVKDNLKYAFVACADYRGRYKVSCQISSGVTGSDIVKIYGPAVGTVVQDVSGKCGDDAVSFQTKEPPAYAAYQMAYGDIIGCKAIDTTVDSPVANISAVVAYGSPGEHMDVVADGIHGAINGAAFRAQAGDSITGANISSVVCRRVTASARLAAQIGGGSGGMLQVGLARIENPVHNPLQATDPCIETKSTATIKHLVVSALDSNVGDVASPAWPSSTAVGILLAGVVKQFSLLDSSLNGSQTNYRAVQVSNGAAVNKINVGRTQAKVNRLVNLQATGAVTPTISLSDNYIEAPQVVVCASSANVHAVGNEFVGATGGVVQQSAGTVTLTHGANTLSGGSVITSGTVGTTAL